MSARKSSTSFNQLNGFFWKIWYLLSDYVSLFPLTGGKLTAKNGSPASLSLEAETVCISVYKLSPNLSLLSHHRLLWFHLHFVSWLCILINLSQVLSGKGRNIKPIKKFVPDKKGQYKYIIHRSTDICTQIVPQIEQMLLLLFSETLEEVPQTPFHDMIKFFRGHP